MTRRDQGMYLLFILASGITAGLDTLCSVKAMARARWVVVIAHLILGSLSYHYGVDGFLVRSAPPLSSSSSSSSSSFDRTTASRRAPGGRPSQTRTRMASTTEVSSAPFF